MRYLIIDEIRKQNCIGEILKLNEWGKWEVVIQEYKKKRTSSQNNLYWMWLPYLSKHFGYTDEEMHDELKYAFIGEEEYTNRKGIKRIRPKSTTRLKVEDFAKFLTKIEVLARANNIRLPIPHDYKFAMMNK